MDLVDELADRIAERVIERLASRTDKLAALAEDGTAIAEQQRGLLTAKEAQKYVCLERHVFDQHVRAGEIPCIRLGERRRRFRIVDLDRFIEQRKHTGRRG